MSEEENEESTLQQTADPIEWLRLFLSDNVSPAEAMRQIVDIQPNPQILQAIESVRAVIEKGAARSRQRNQKLDATTQQLDTLSEVWNTAGGEELRKSLEPEAAREIEILASICAELNLSPDRALQKESQVSALGAVIEKYLASEDHVVSRRCALAETQAVLRTGAQELLRGSSLLSQVKSDAERRDTEKKSNVEKSGTLKAKADQYTLGAVTFKQRMSKAGLKSNATHEAVVAEGNKLKKLESELAGVEKELAVYHDLPPVCTCLRNQVPLCRTISLTS